MCRAIEMTWLLGLALVLEVSVVSGSASAEVYLPVPTEAIFRTAFTPTRLPAHEAKPVSLAIEEAIENRDGSHPPALRELRVDLDRHFALSVEGLPSCARPLGGRQSRQNPFEKCEEAEVGSGIVEVEVAFPEQTPVPVSGQLHVYNGGFWKGRTVFWLFTYLPAPVTGGILMPFEIRRDAHGRYSWVGELEIPKIANGSGSITHLGARFRKGVFSASCAKGRLLTAAASRFPDGAVARSLGIRTCKTAGSG